MKKYDPKVVGRPVGARKPKAKADIERSVEVACKRLSERSIRVLSDALDPALTPEIDYKTRIDAAKEILNRAWGKPRQQMDVNMEMSIKGVAEALEAARRRVIENEVNGAPVVKIRPDA